MGLFKRFNLFKLNTGIHRAFEEELMKDVYVAKYPQFNGAVGAALIASEKCEKIF